MIAYWSSSTGNTAKFVEDLGLPNIRIPNSGEMPVMDQPFVLITPTFADAHGRGAVPKPVILFLNEPANRGALLLGVIGGGNRNFGDLFCIGARVAAEKCGKPVLYKFELRGMGNDIENVRTGMTRLLAQHARREVSCPDP
ncbi:class Ib ribonucleoside-diphosphate reductase assembly flavoprotein NrdI [Paracoccus litorisediminis]|uniref:class Ib ribonucleoside-diphosphate reductase assembly flavoprotein NrdI n=1 Tax=Paracoccus litorisediminis TaxID=2006130 RepID=UPI0037303376